MKTRDSSLPRRQEPNQIKQLGSRLRGRDGFFEAPDDDLGLTLVMGTTGFIGRRLMRAGDRALSRNAGGHDAEVFGDLHDPALLLAACRGVDTVFHCACYAHAFASADPDAHRRINFDAPATWSRLQLRRA